MNYHHQSGGALPERLLHPLHPTEGHSLVNLDAGDFICDACRIEGRGASYSCPPCDFILHEFCSACPVQLWTRVHPEHPLFLQTFAVEDSPCELCQQPVEGISYRCVECDMRLHPLCTQLKRFALRLDVDQEHALILHAKGKREQVAKPCERCTLPCDQQWWYRCTKCDVNVHVHCPKADSPNEQQDDLLTLQMRSEHQQLINETQMKLAQAHFEMCQSSGNAIKNLAG